MYVATNVKACCLISNHPVVDTTPKKSTPTKSVVINNDSDTEIKTKKSKIASEEQQPSSTVRNRDESDVASKLGR